MEYALVVMGCIIAILAYILYLAVSNSFVEQDVSREIRLDCLRAELKVKDLGNKLKEKETELKELNALLHNEIVSLDKHNNFNSNKVEKLISLAIHNDNQNEARNSAMQACKILAKEMGLK